jgi:hypothetical protein
MSFARRDSTQVMRNHSFGNKGQAVACFTGFVCFLLEPRLREVTLLVQLASEFRTLAEFLDVDLRCVITRSVYDIAAHRTSHANRHHT